MRKMVEFDHNGNIFGTMTNCNENVTAEDLKARKAKFKGLKDIMVLEADNDLETLMAVYQMNRNSQNSRKAIINCLKTMAVVRA